MNSDLIQSFMQGFMLYAGLTIALGPRNLYLLRQGMSRQYLFTTATITSLTDALLIALGVGGFGAAIMQSQDMFRYCTWLGVIFLVVYALRSFHSAYTRPDLQNGCLDQSAMLPLKGVVLSAMSISLLNPAAYVDTLLVVGTTSTQYLINDRIMFGLGAMLAGCVWFFVLTYSASRLSSFFRNARSWKTLDMVSGCIMLWLAASLVASP